MNSQLETIRGFQADNERMRGALGDARFFIQDSITNGFLDGGALGNAYGARDVIDAALSSSPDLVGLGEGNQEDMAARDQSHTATAAPVASDVAEQQHPGAEQ